MSGTRASFHGSRYATSSSKLDRSRRFAALTRSRSAPPRPRPLVSQRMRADDDSRSEELDITEAQIPTTKCRHGAIRERPPREHWPLAGERHEAPDRPWSTDPDRIVRVRVRENATAELPS